jgi:hydrogenase maturation protease
MKRILIAGVGNVFLGDDAFGVTVAQELTGAAFPPEVRVVDFGIRSYDLAFALNDGCDAAILVDAAPRGKAAGTLYLIEPDLEQLDQLAPSAANAHTMNLVSVFQMARSLGEGPARLYVVGCEPGKQNPPEGRWGLSAPVRAAVPAAIQMIQSLVKELSEPATKTNRGLAPV